MNQEEQVRQLFRDVQQSHRREKFWLAAAVASVTIFLGWLIGLFS